MEGRAGWKGGRKEEQGGQGRIVGRKSRVEGREKGRVTREGRERKEEQEEV